MPLGLRWAIHSLITGAWGPLSLHRMLSLGSVLVILWLEHLPHTLPDILVHAPTVSLELMLISGSP